MSMRSYHEDRAYRAWRRRLRRALLRLTVTCAVVVALAYLITQPFPITLL